MEGAIKNGNSRDTGNIGHSRHITKTSKAQHTNPKRWTTLTPLKTWVELRCSGRVGSSFHSHHVTLGASDNNLRKQSQRNKTLYCYKNTYENNVRTQKWLESHTLQMIVCSDDLIVCIRSRGFPQCKRTLVVVCVLVLPRNSNMEYDKLLVY